MIDASAHTSKQWRVQVEPAYDSSNNRRLSAHKFDYQDRIIEEASGLYEAADGSWNAGPDTEVHTFSYDPNGNKASYTDPRGRLTTYEYDLRNRLWKTHETVNTIPRTTETLYDPTNNKTDVIFPDTRSQHWQDYDGYGQAWTFIDERNNRTDLTFIWGPMKKLYTVTTHRDTDAGGNEDQRTWFSYDLMGKPTRVDFPDGTFPNCSYEESTYEFGQLKTFRTRKGQLKTINYDARGREVSHTWSDGQTPGISRSWDDANRAVTLCNIYSTIDFSYDGAGLVLKEGNTITGSGGRTETNFWRYADGNVSDIQYPDGISIHREYTARGQLKSVRDSLSSQPVIDYTYLADGKVDYADYRNGVRTAYAYDGRGMTQVVDHYRVSGSQDLSWRQYTRDERDRIVSFQKGTSGYNPMENGRGDRFRYDEEGQLVEGWYNAADPANAGDGAWRYDGFNYDALGNRRGWDYIGSKGQWLNFTRKDNGLNEYRMWSPFSVINYDDDIGGSWGTPGAANGVIMQDGNITGGYNALNQPMLITSNAVAPNWVFFGYDPLGRCVKRWLAPSPSDGSLVPPPDSNPATYFYYDGWNLIQEGSSYANASRNYVHGARVDEVVKQITPNNWWERYFQYDARGHCTLQTDASGNIVEQYEYDAFGQPYFYDYWGNNIRYSPWGNRFLFTGREYIGELKLYDFRNRLYQPELGRFMQPDPKEFGAGDYNLYRYCHNDPVNRNDPLGLDTLIIWGGPIEGSANVFGHVAVATSGQGVQSVGNGTNAGNNFSHASTTEYLAAQAQLRNTLLFTIRTTPEQERKINAYLDARANIKPDRYSDNCAARTSEALKAAGLDMQKTHFPQSVFEQSKRVLGGTQSAINKGEGDKAQQYSSFNKSPDSADSYRLVTPLGTNIPVKVQDE